MLHPNTLLWSSALSLLWSPVWINAAQAQDANDEDGVASCPVKCEPTPETSSAVTAYQPDFFSTYNPVTALDMVRQVPGFSISNGEQARGFGGTAGNVLVNGERPSTKSNNLEEILQRIALSRVVRIELIRGSMPGIDMRGLSRVVNVVLCECSEGGQGTFNAKSTLRGRRIFFTGEATYALRLFDADVTLSLQRNGNGRRIKGFEDVRDQLGQLTQRRDEQAQVWFREWQPTFSVEKKFENGDALRLNGKYWNWMWDLNLVRQISVEQNSALAPGGFDFVKADNKGYGYEIGGDYERAISPNRSAKLIFVNTLRVNNFFDTSDDFSAVGFTQGFQVDVSERRKETILRLLYDWTLNGRHTVQFGTEGALNSRLAGTDIFQNLGLGFVQIPLPVSNTKVSEKRGEVFGSWVYTPTSKLTLESGLRYEISEISQSGDASRKRTFKFPKPSFSATWNVSLKDQLRASMERKVAQLNFGDFVSSVNLTDSLTNVGNPELEPDRTWAFETSWERRFGAKGSVNLKYHYDWISQAQGLVPINNTFDAIGNLGNATRWFVNVQARLPLDSIGLSNATLDANVTIKDSSVIDPVTGQSRIIGDEEPRRWSLDFRQDLNAIKMAWGWNYQNGPTFKQFRLFEKRTIDRGYGNLDAFIETTRIKGMTITAAVDNILEQKNKRTRVFFDGSRANGIVASTAVRTRETGRVYSITVKGTF